MGLQNLEKISGLAPKSIGVLVKENRAVTVVESPPAEVPKKVGRALDSPGMVVTKSNAQKPVGSTLDVPVGDALSTISSPSLGNSGALPPLSTVGEAANSSNSGIIYLLVIIGVCYFFCD